MVSPDRILILSLDDLKYYNPKIDEGNMQEFGCLVPDKSSEYRMGARDLLLLHPQYMCEESIIDTDSDGPDEDVSKLILEGSKKVLHRLNSEAFLEIPDIPNIYYVIAEHGFDPHMQTFKWSYQRGLFAPEGFGNR